jgi:GntR family transcriptional regulator/MocR family aminotransferase
MSMLSIDRDDQLPLYCQIENQLRTSILDGRLGPGTRLPSIRELAAQLGIARNTVQTAYEQLTAEGYLVGQVGSGTRVAPELPDLSIRVGPVAASASTNEQVRGYERIAPVLSERVLALGAFPFSPGVEATIRHDFRPGSGGFDLFPARVWERCLRDAWRDLVSLSAGKDLGYPDPHGDRSLREAIRDYLGASRGVRTDVDQILITRGAQSAYATAAQLWLSPGRRFAVEDPGHLAARSALACTGAFPLGVAVDDQGLIIGQIPRDASLVLVTPSWQYPLGGTLPIPRRLALLEWARRSGGIVIEDDYDSELRYTGHPLPSMQGLDAEGRILYVGTFSKVLFPGLRLGYVVVPKEEVAHFRDVLHVHDLGAPVLEQRALATFIRDGHFERHLRRLRLEYWNRQQALVNALDEELGSLLATEPRPAGIHLISTILTDRLSAQRVREIAAEGGIAVETVARHRIRPGGDRQLMLGYSHLPSGEIRVGIRRLARLVARESQARASSATGWTSSQHKDRAAPDPS